MARRPVPSARSLRVLRGPGRDAGAVGGAVGGSGGRWADEVDPQQRLVALLTRGDGHDVDPARTGRSGPDGWDGGLDGGDDGEVDEEVDEGVDEGVDEELEDALHEGLDDGRGDLDEQRGGSGSGRGSGVDRAAGRHRRRAASTGREAPRVWSLPSSLVDARRVVSWRAVAAVAVLVALAGGVLAVRVGSARASAQPQTVSAPDPLTRASTPAAFASGGAPPNSSPPSRATSAAVTPSAATPSAAATSAAQLVVDVAGQVVRPGVVRLPAGARVADALALAGGTAPDADLSTVNLARPLVDGERVYVPRPGEAPPSVLGPVVAGAAGGAAVGGGSAGGSTGGTASGTGGSAAGAPVDLNTADLAALDALPGVGPVLAQRILDWRGQHGRFSSVDELGEVSGIGDKLLGTLRPLVVV